MSSNIVNSRQLILTQCDFLPVGAQVVAQGIANFFSTLALDLQGIEIKQPVLTLHSGAVSDSQEGDLLEIALKLKLRAFPPLDMQF